MRAYPPRVFCTVHFEDGDRIQTWINGTAQTALDYYAPGRSFNLGDGAGGDRMVRVSCVVIEADSAPSTLKIASDSVQGIL
jgi:hypothetical protein